MKSNARSRTYTGAVKNLSVPPDGSSGGSLKHLRERHGGVEPFSASASVPHGLRREPMPDPGGIKRDFAQERTGEKSRPRTKDTTTVAKAGIAKTYASGSESQENHERLLRWYDMAHNGKA